MQFAGDYAACSARTPDRARTVQNVVHDMMFDTYTAAEEGGAAGVMCDLRKVCANCERKNSKWEEYVCK